MLSVVGEARALETNGRAKKHAVKTGVRDSQTSHRLLVRRQGTYRQDLYPSLYLFLWAGWLAN